LSAALQRTAGWPGAVVLIAVLMLAAGIFQTSRGHAVLAKAGLFQKPVTFTSLAFASPQDLPAQLAAKNATVPVSFVIHNSGSSARTYRWSVFVVQAGGTRQVQTGRVRLGSGRGSAIRRSAAVSCAGGRLQIVVELASPAEAIDACTACWSPRS
jgi:hypothetical protein